MLKGMNPWLVLAIGVLVGAVAAPKVRALIPVRLPTIGG